MKKSFRKLIPAILMVLLSASLMGTSTFAWFSMNSKVTTTGMKVRTRVADDLLIAASTTAEDDLAEDNTFDTSLVQTRNALLEPASTINGKDFYWTSTKNVAKSGDARTEAYTLYNEDTANADAAADKANYDNEFNSNYAISAPTEVAYAYVDYAFDIKATNTQTYAQQLRVTALNLVYGNTQAKVEKAFRIAIFVNDRGANGATNISADTVGTLKNIYRVDGAHYFSNANGAGDVATEKAVSATDAAPSTAVNSLDAKAPLAELGAGLTNYYKVVVRLWLEGEDTTCNNDTFAKLTDEWALDLTLQLVESTNDEVAKRSVQYINEPAGAAKTVLVIGTDNGDDSVPADVITIANVAYYPISDKTLNTKQLYVSANKTLSAASRIFTIDDIYPTEVTNQMDISVTLTQTLSDTCTSSVGASTTSYGKAFTATYTKAEGKTFTGTVKGTDVTVTVGGDTLDAGKYTWTIAADGNTATLTIPDGADITGNVIVTVTAKVAS